MNETALSAAAAAPADGGNQIIVSIINLFQFIPLILLFILDFIDSLQPTISNDGQTNSIDIDLNDPNSFDCSTSTILMGKYTGYKVQQAGNRITIYTPPTDINQQQQEQQYNQPQILSSEQQTLENSFLGTSFNFQNIPIETSIDDIVEEMKKMKTDINDLELKIEDVLSKQDAQAEIIGKIYQTCLNLDRFLTGKSGNEIQFKMSNDTKTTITGDSRADEHGIEDFEDLESMKIKSSDELKEFEQKLADRSFLDRTIRFLRMKFNFTQKGEVIFKLVIRQLTDPELFIPFSWKGKGSRNLGFAKNHNLFVSFMCRIVRMAHPQSTSADVDKMFENHLRFKKQNFNRELHRGNRPPNFPSARNRIPIASDVKGAPANNQDTSLQQEQRINIQTSEENDENTTISDEKGQTISDGMEQTIPHEGTDNNHGQTTSNQNENIQ